MREPDDPIRTWREEHARRVLNVDFKPASGTRFRARLKTIFEPLRMTRVTLSPCRVVRDAALVKDGDDSVAVVIAQAEGMQLAHRGCEQCLGRGDAAIMRASETGSVGSRNDFGYITFTVPHAELAACSPHVDRTAAQRVPRRNEALQLLRAYICRLERHPVGTSAVLRGPVRRHVIDFVALAIALNGAVGESALGAVAAARLAAALDCMSKRSQEPELSIADVAAEQRISPRYLQRLIGTLGTSFTERLNELRLQEALRLLRDERNGQRISDIALEVGFSDISTFNRLFRSRFDDTPSGIRARSASLVAPFH